MNKQILANHSETPMKLKLSILTKNKSKLMLIRQTYYSRTFSWDKTKKYIAKEYIPNILLLQNTDSGILFLKKHRYPYLPKTVRRMIGKRKFLLQEFINGSTVEFNKMSPQQLTKIAEAVSKLHSIKTVHEKPLLLFLNKKRRSGFS